MKKFILLLPLFICGCGNFSFKHPSYREITKNQYAQVLLWYQSSDYMKQKVASYMKDGQIDKYEFEQLQVAYYTDNKKALEIFLEQKSN